MLRLWKFSKDGYSAQVRVNGDRSTDDASLARQWAVAGVGVVSMTPIEQQADLKAGRLVRVLDDWEAAPYENPISGRR